MQRCRLLDVEIVDSTLYLIFEFVSIDLHKYIRSRQPEPLPADEIKVHQDTLNFFPNDGYSIFVSSFPESFVSTMSWGRSFPWPWSYAQVLKINGTFRPIIT